MMDDVHHRHGQRVPREQLYTADEVFLTGTASEITPVRSIDRIPVGTGAVGPVTLRLQQALLDYARGKVPDRWGWRTRVWAHTEERVA